MKICCGARRVSCLPLPPINFVIFLLRVTSCDWEGVAIRGVSAAVYTPMLTPVGICVVIERFRTSSISSLYDVSATLTLTLLPLQSVSILRGSSSLFSFVNNCALFSCSVFRRFPSPSSSTAVPFRNVVPSPYSAFHFSVMSVDPPFSLPPLSWPTLKSFARIYFRMFRRYFFRNLLSNVCFEYVLFRLHPFFVDMRSSSSLLHTICISLCISRYVTINCPPYVVAHFLRIFVAYIHKLWISAQLFGSVYIHKAYPSFLIFYSRSALPCVQRIHHG